jgi:ribosomal protein S6
MKNRYEGLLILNVKGNEDSAKEIIERLEGEFKKNGAELEQVQKIGSRHFSYAAGASDSGYYVNFVFHGAPTIIEKLKSQFRLDSDIYRQHYQKLAVRKQRAVAAAQ